jgi:hypothetical protein
MERRKRREEEQKKNKRLDWNITFIAVGEVPI